MTAIRHPHRSGKTNTKALLGVWPMVKALAYVVDDSRWGL
jgi:hypothetical protein